MTSKRDKLLELIRIGQEQDIVPVDAILELGKMNTRELMAQITVVPELWPSDKLTGMIPADLLPLYTLETRGAVPPPHKLDLVLGSRGWQPMPTQTTIYKTGGGGGGTRYHNQLLDLDYATSGHTGFQAQSAILIALSGLGDAVGWLHNDGAGNLVWSTPAGGGNVFGAAPTVINNFAYFDNITGTLIKDSGFNAASFATAAHTHAGVYQPVAGILTTLSALANGAGWLQNDGFGVLSWTTPPTHAAVTLDINADTILSLSTQALGLDTQTAAYVWAGPTAGVPAVPTFRALLATDIPALSYQAPGNYITALTTDVTASGPGSVVATIAAGAVTLAKMADMATASLIYRKSALAGPPEVNTLATLKTDLGSMPPTQHDIVGALHSVTGAAGQLVGLSALNTLGLVSPSPSMLGNGAMQYQTIITGANPFTPVYSGFLLDGTTGGKTVFAVTNAKTLTLTSTGDFNLTIPATGTAARTQDKLSAFAATTSAELAGVISDESGSGSAVFATRPTLTNAAETCQLLSDAASVVWNTDLGTVAYVKISGSRVIANPTNFRAGGHYVLYIQQDITGGWQPTWGTAYLWNDNKIPVVNTLPFAMSVFGFISDGTYLFGTTTTPRVRGLAEAVVYLGEVITFKGEIVYV